MPMEGNPSTLHLEENETAYPNPEINNTEIEFKRLIISNEPKPVEDSQIRAPGVKTHPAVPAGVPDSMPRKNIIEEELVYLFKTTFAATSALGHRDFWNMEQAAEAAPAPPDEANTEATVYWYSERTGLDRNQDHILEEQRRSCSEVRMSEKAKKKKETERKKSKKKKKKKQVFARNDYLKKRQVFKNNSRTAAIIPMEMLRNSFCKRVAMVHERYLSAKQNQNGKVWLSNILRNIVDDLFKNKVISYLFQKPVTEKEAPDYFDIVKQPMDLSIIRAKVHNMEYKSHKEFRSDVWQITSNAHQYSGWRNPGIPPLADRLLELCDHLLEKYKIELEPAEGRIEFTGF